MSRPTKNTGTAKKKGSDVDPIVVWAVVAVAVVAIVAVAANIDSYYQGFGKPAIALLNGSGLAENYPFEVSNTTPISLELAVIKPQSDNTRYAVSVYASNGTDYTAEQAGPIGMALFTLNLPDMAGNVTLPVSLTLTYVDAGGALVAKTIQINSQTATLNFTLPYRVVGLFFQLDRVGASGAKSAVPYAWTSIWFNVTTT